MRALFENNGGLTDEYDRLVREEVLDLLNALLEREGPQSMYYEMREILKRGLTTRELADWLDAHRAGLRSGTQ